MSEAAPTVFTQYVFVDVVEFASGTRSVEAQADIIHALNGIVTSAVSSVGLKETDVIYFPAGDGLCIALPGLENESRVAPSYDLHLRLGLAVLEKLSHYNEDAEGARQFEVRVGINQNVDNVVLDINGKRSLAGAGINTAQRIMDQAGGMQLLVGENVYNTLRHREKYMGDVFKPYTTTSKHGESLRVYQFREGSLTFLNGDVLPSLISAQARARERMSRLEAYYLLHAEQQRELIVAHAENSLDRDAAVVWLYMLAADSIRSEQEPRPFGSPLLKTGPRPTDPPEEQMKHYRALDVWVVDEFVDRLLAKKLYRIASEIPDRCFTTTQAIERLRREWPDIAERLTQTSGLPDALNVAE